MIISSIPALSQPALSQHIHEWVGPSSENMDGKLLGKVVGDRYFSHDGWFSVAVPKPVWDGYVTDHYPLPNLGGVMFFNNAGYLMKIEIDILPAEVCSIISKHPEIKNEVLDALFYEALLPQLKESVPALHVMYERKLLLEGDEPTLYAVINMPESATIMDKYTGRCMDSKRGYMLMFSQDKRLVVFSIQDTYSLLPGCADTASIYLKERLLSHLIKIQASYRYEMGGNLSTSRAYQRQGVIE
jgi:hypothetical protein